MITFYETYYMGLAAPASGGSSPTPAAGGGKLLGFVNHNTTMFPVGAQRNDWVRVAKNETVFPFTIQGVTFTNVNDTAIFTGSQWIKYSFTAETDTVEVHDSANESLSGTATLQSAVNIENKEKIEEIEERLKKMYNFIGYVSTTAPADAAKGDLWYNSDVLPTVFPIQVKTFDGTDWSTTTTPYTPANFDTWSNKNDDKGYYWFANEWNINDANVLVDDETIELNNAGELQLKDDGIKYKHINSGEIVTSIGDGDFFYCFFREYDDSGTTKTEYVYTKSLDDGNPVAVYSIENKEITNLGNGVMVTQVLTYNGNTYARYADSDNYYIDRSNKTLINTDVALDLFRKLQDVGSDVFTDVEIDLPLSNIQTDTIYRLKQYVYETGGVEIPSAVFYKDNGRTPIQATETELTYTDSGGNVVTLPWADVTDAVVDDMLTNEYIVTCEYEEALFCKIDTDEYVYHTAVDKVAHYTLYYNPTGLASDYIEIGGGGTSDVEVDNLTVTKVADKLQANAILDVVTLPSGNIKENSVYRIIENTPIRMVKLFIYKDGEWKNLSRIYISAENYDLLTDAQKNDGTVYIVDDLSQYLIQFTYRTLAEKPSINGITLLDSLTLDDLGIYSKTQIDNFLANKAQAEFVDELPPTLQQQVWYYSKKFSDGTTVPNDNRALYILDNNDVLQYMGVVGEVTVGDYVEKSNVKTTLDGDFYYRFVGGTSAYYTKTVDDGNNIPVYAITMAGNKVTAITQQTDTGTLSDGTLTYNGADYAHSVAGDGFYVVNGTDKVVATSALREVLNRAGRVNDVKINSKSIVENKEAVITGIETLENNYYYRWVNGTNYKYTKTRTVGTGVTVYSMAFDTTGVTSITQEAVAGSITVPSNGVGLQLTHGSNTYLLDNSYTSSKYYMVGANDKLLAGGLMNEEKDFNRCFENVQFTKMLDKPVYYSGNSAFVYRTSASAGLTITGDFTSAIPRNLHVSGGMVFLTFHLVGTATSASANWTYLGFVPAGLRPKQRTTVSAVVYNGNLNEACGGDISTSGEIRIWCNPKTATNNYQVRITAFWQLAD